MTEGEKNKQTTKTSENTKMVLVHLYLWLITVNVNGLNFQNQHA